MSLILTQILSHRSYTKETSQLDVQYHQHMPLPSMYQDHQHTITRYVSQPCPKECTKPSTCTIPNINHVPQQVHQPCTNTCTKPCINLHASTPAKNCALTMYHNLYHMPQPSTMCINNVHEHYTMYQSCTIPCAIPCANHAHQS
jgi:hypothetical protein